MKNLFTLLAIIIGVNSIAQIQIGINSDHGSDDVGDGTAEVIIEHGRPPFKYYWSQANIDIYTSKATGLIEGESIGVKVVDSTGASDSTYVIIPISSGVEKINIGMKPTVDIIEKLFFFKLYEEEIKVKSREINSPFWKSEDYSSLKLTKWLVEDGAQVKHEDPICIVSTEKESITVYAIGDGTIHQKLKVGQEVREKDGDQITKPNALCVIEYDPNYAYLQANGSAKTTNVPLIVVRLVL